ncbi:unnamed protein product [Rangifer tarandus platyrhynchus]|uniref:Uncharacterized protein n=2 Tax=Rangifer tarandus platyrhynchus TaxID=3082113 RepID=A0ACB0E5V6_RANTA|nr:unnamed protein product [Rangifer tarandus platyrhynchus]
MGRQSSKVPRSDLTAKEAADASPSKADRQGNGHVKSNGDYPCKDEGDPTPKKGTEEAAGATGDAIEPAPPRQGAEAKGAREAEQEQGEMVPCSKEGTAQEGKAVATPQSQEHQAKGAEASATSKGGGTEEAGPEVAEPPTLSGSEGGPTPASEQNE